MGPHAVLQASAQGLVFLSSWRGGVVAGVECGSGFALARLPRGSWSAPCFVTITREEVGAVLGLEHESTLMVSVTRVGVEELAAGRYHTFGTDVSVQVGVSLPLEGLFNLPWTLLSGRLEVKH